MCTLQFTPTVVFLFWSLIYLGYHQRLLLYRVSLYYRGVS